MFARNSDAVKTVPLARKLSLANTHKVQCALSIYDSLKPMEPAIIRSEAYLAEPSMRAGLPREGAQMLSENWILQTVFPRDFFESCTLTVPQWLENETRQGLFPTKMEKWRVFMRACAVAWPAIKHEELREEPRVGFDPVGDQLFFLFKASNNGTTYFVSQTGIAFPSDDLI